MDGFRNPKTTAEPMINLHGPETDALSSLFFRVSFSGRPPPGNEGPFSDKLVSENGVWI